MNYETHPSSGFFSGIPGILCFLIPIAGVIFIVFRVVRGLMSGSKNSNTGPGMSGATMNRGPSSFTGTKSVRIVNDGFWLLLDAAQGTLIHYAYHPAGGMEVTDQLTYKPGAEGHFVYTGAAPESVRVISVGDVVDDSLFSSSSTSFNAGPGAHIPPSMPRGSSGSHLGPSSSRYPSAY